MSCELSCPIGHRSPVLDVVGPGGGAPLDNDTRVDMESRLGHGKARATGDGGDMDYVAEPVRHPRVALRPRREHRARVPRFQHDGICPKGHPDEAFRCFR